MKSPAALHCLAHQFDPAGLDLEQADDMTALRSATRLRLLTEGAVMTVDVRKSTTHATADHLDRVLAQWRKARSGRSLELRTREILIEDALREGVDFEHGPQSEPGKRPDFLFFLAGCLL